MPINKKDLKFLKKEFTKICKFYEVDISFDNKTSTSQFIQPNKIILGILDLSYRRVLEVFCHEMAHFLNYENGKYPLFHGKIKSGTMRVMYNAFKTHKRVAAYALRAEVYTDKVAKKFAKEWFPELKYEASYDFSPRSKGKVFYDWARYE